MPEHSKNYTDFSGSYACTVEDALKGKYVATVTLNLRPVYSKANYASYDLKLEVPSYGVYFGHAAGNGNQLAIHFALPTEYGQYGGSAQDFGSGIAKFKINPAGKLSFYEFYFKPVFLGGSTGVKDCVKTE